MAYNSNLNDSYQERIRTAENEDRGKSITSNSTLGLLSIFKKIKRKITNFLFDDESPEEEEKFESKIKD